MAGSLADILTGLGTTVGSLLTDLAPDTFDVLSKQTEDDGGGAQRQQWLAANGSPLPCFLNPKAGRKQVAADRWETVTDHELLCAADVEVTEENRIEVHARGALPLRRFTIDSIQRIQGVAILLKLILDRPNSL